MKHRREVVCQQIPAGEFLSRWNLTAKKEVRSLIQGQQIILWTSILPRCCCSFFSKVKAKEIFRYVAEEVILKLAIEESIDMPPVVKNRVDRRKDDTPLPGEVFAAEDLVKVELIDVIRNKEAPLEAVMPAVSNNGFDVLKDHIEPETVNPIVRALRKAGHGETNVL